jgi:hypothetical protein
MLAITEKTMKRQKRADEENCMDVMLRVSFAATSSPLSGPTGITPPYFDKRIC